ncbi:hypothetical protein BASA50_010609 [Batrachochytrium salamandrivorans]|uniref:Uncharacterized protein n=1 Tax=Batrachochytrium salamandrivorans TaxID=1357716 RepID=A0ABQ8F0Z2_9FUNG|nr:hypothetical protein BASA50_010609 [Batrachochytrium salamandrivorans]
MFGALLSASPLKNSTSSAPPLSKRQLPESHPTTPLLFTQTDNMRLISFVAISFLAITVSAYPGLGTPSQSTTTEDIQSPPSIAPQGEQQFDQDGVQAERARLTAAYEKEDESFSPMNSRLEINRQEITDLTAKANLIAIRFRETDLDDDDRRTLRKSIMMTRRSLMF